MPSETAAALFQDWVMNVVEWTSEDESLPGGLDSINLALNRKRLAEFLEQFASDSDLQDFLVLDLIGVSSGAEISSTGEVELVPDLSLRPFRLWEYVWLYKTLSLSTGGKRVLDLGGPASHILMLAALAGNTVHSVDINPRIVAAGRTCAEAFQLKCYRADVGDMRDLSSIASESVDRIVCCSVLEHLTGPDQMQALTEMARVLAPGGVIGLTFDYGTPAPGVNIYLPPPHDPPETAEEVRRRYVQSDLEILGDGKLENPLPGSLFRTREVSYAIGALFLGKPPNEPPPAPAPLQRERSITSDLRVKDLLFRLQIKARADLARLQDGRMLREVAKTRLAALEEADRELQILYPELSLRNQELNRLQDEAERRLVALRSAHAEMDRLHGELKRREDGMLEMQTHISEQESRTRGLESEIRKLRDELSRAEQDLTSLRTENLLGYIRRRWE